MIARPQRHDPDRSWRRVAARCIAAARQSAADET
jgi:hypothetical protein